VLKNGDHQDSSCNRFPRAELGRARHGPNKARCSSTEPDGTRRTPSKSVISARMTIVTTAELRYSFR